MIFRKNFKIGLDNGKSGAIIAPSKPVTKSSSFAKPVVKRAADGVIVAVGAK